MAMKIRGKKALANVNLKGTPGSTMLGLGQKPEFTTRFKEVSGMRLLTQRKLLRGQSNLLSPNSWLLTLHRMRLI